MKSQKLFLAGSFVIVALLSLAAGFALAQGFEPAGGVTAQATPVGTGFTYQGYLTDASGNPVTGNCDFQFGLWDAETGGTQIGITQTVSSVSVDNGTFLIEDLDFGEGAFKGEARWLQIAVRCPAGSGGYTPLSPRQAIKPVPYALALPGLWTEQRTYPNVIGGYKGNEVTAGAKGAVIAGGGSVNAYATPLPNRVTDDYGAIGGGYANQAGNDDANPINAGGTVVGGGMYNTASSSGATVAGGYGNTASGWDSTVAGGGLNTASGSYSTVAGGSYNSAEASYSTVPGGYGAKATRYGQFAYASGYFSNPGDAQTSLYVLRTTTTDATETEMFLDGYSQRITVEDGQAILFDILVLGRGWVNSTSEPRMAGYRFTGVITNIAGVTYFVGSPVKVVLGEDDTAFDANVYAGGGALMIKVKGNTGTTVTWVASVRTVESR